MRSLCLINLDNTDSLWGDCKIFDGNPAVETHRSVYYLPWLQGGAWGVFDRSDQPLMASIDLAGEENRTIAQPLNSYMRYREMGGKAPDNRYIYGGRLTNHYGHFLIESLARYWHVGEVSLRARSRWSTSARPKILVHGYETETFGEKNTYAGEIFSALGLQQDDFVSFSRPLKVRELLIPRTSFHQQYGASKAYYRMCQRIGARLLDGVEVRTNDRPAWLSKARLETGVRRFKDELLVEEELAKHGVEIVYPETLTIKDKVALFASRTTLMGTVGSAFHGSIFAPKLGRRILLNGGPTLNSNFALFDKLTGSRAEYVYSPSSTEAPSPQFNVEVSLADPINVARDLLGML